MAGEFVPVGVRRRYLYVTVTCVTIASMKMRTVAGAAVTVALLFGGCQARRSAWNQALVDTDCHAANVIIKKGDPGKLEVTACGKTRTYDCPDGGECVLADARAMPDAADPTASPSADEVMPQTEPEQMAEPEEATEPEEMAEPEEATEPEAATEATDEPVDDDTSLDDSAAADAFE